MTIEFTVSVVISAPPEAIFDAWMDSDGHTKMTGGTAHAAPEVGAAFDAWGGHITGTNLELERPTRIVQSWRTEDYRESDGHSQIEVTLEPVQGGTKLTLVHTNVPADQASHEPGWVTHYFEPMKNHFGNS